MADIGLQLLHACEYMHSKQVIHTDIKSKNILLAAGPEGSYTIKLVDMGSSLFTSWWHPPIIGTMEYRAPETLLQVGSLLAHPGLPPLSGVTSRSPKTWRCQTPLSSSRTARPKPR